MERDDTMLSEADIEALRGWLRIKAHRLFQSTPQYGTSDLVQDVLVEYSRNWESLRYGEREESEKWLYAALQRKIADLLRKQSAAKRNVHRERSLGAAGLEAILLDGALSPDCQAENVEDRQRIWAVMTELPELQQEALRLKFVERLSNRQIAERFGCQHQSVVRLIRRGLKQIQKRLSRRPDSAESQQDPRKRGDLKARKPFDERRPDSGGSGPTSSKG